MTTGLSQRTLDTLHAFARRRRLLIAARGLCFGIVWLLVIMSAIAIIDALFIITSQSLRTWLSIAGYAAAGLIVWFTSLRALVRIPGPRELARLIEHRAPGLREDLLSAVELGAPGADARFDSPVFRGLLQASVERRLDQVEVHALLPAGLIRRAAILATLVLLTCIALLLVPDLHFANRLTRALLPLAQVDRVSSVRVKIIAPAPADTLVPHNDSVRIVVELAGGEADEVVLETFRVAGDRESKRIALTPAGDDRQFAGTIELGSESVGYRVLAGDAVTRTYTLEAAARPRPVAFRKTYQPPDYTRLGPQTTDDKHGNIEALIGTTVQLELEVDQPISSGELRFDDGDATGSNPAATRTNAIAAAIATVGPATIPLVRIDDGRWQATVPIQQSTLYKVHLVAARTGFDNAFDPPYEITATPDAPPVLTITSPAADALRTTADSLSVNLVAQDDLGLIRVAQWFRINGGQWMEIVFADFEGPKRDEPQPREHREQRIWHLMDLNLRVGDQVAVKFTATDGAGNRTESAPVRITMVPDEFDPHRLAGLETRRALLAAITTLGTLSEHEAQSLRQAMEQWPAAGQLQRRQLATGAAESAARLDEQAQRTWREVMTALKANSSGTQADELERLGIINRHMQAAIADMKLHTAKVTGDASAQDHSRGFAVAVAKAELVQSLSRAARISLSQLLASDEMDQLLRDLLAMKREQAAIDPAAWPNEPASWQRLARRQLLLAGQAGQMQTFIAACQSTHERQTATLGLIKDHLVSAQAAAVAVPAESATRASVEAANERINLSLEAAAQQVLPLARELAAQASLAAAALVPDELALHQLAGPLRDSTDVADGSLAGHERWGVAASVLGGAIELHEARSDADAHTVLDRALYRRVLAAIHGRLPGESDDEVRARVARVDQAWRVLDAGHAIHHAHARLLAQAGDEKWLRSPANAITAHTRDWSALYARWPRLIVQWNAARLPEEAMAALTALPRSGAAQILEVEFASRRMTGRVSQKRPAQFEQLAARLASVRGQIEPAMTAARAVLTAEVPTFPEQLAQLAREARAIQKQAEDAAAAIDPADDAKPVDASPVVDAQAALDAKLAELLDELRHEANAQDLFTPQGRELARDADDAAAMIRDPAVKAGEAGRQAANATQGRPQHVHLQEAAHQEDQLAKVLDQLAGHYEAVAQGRGEETRSALREAEKELGIKRELDAQFGRMERLAQLAALPPEQQLAALEEELKQNEAMQQELAAIAREGVATAKDALEDAAAMERRVAQELAAADALAQQAKPDVAGQMQELADQARALAGQVAPIEQQADKAMAADAAMAAGQARQALEQAGKANPPTDAKDHRAAAAEARAMAKSLGDAAGQLKDAAAQAAAAGERVREAERRATLALAIGDVSDQARKDAAQTLLHAKPRQDAAKSAAAAAGKAQAQAQQLAQAAQKLADELSADAAAGDRAIDAGLMQQPAIAEAVDDARENVGRAARHEERMDQGASEAALKESGNRLQAQAAPAVNQAAGKLAEAGEPADALAAVAKAQEAIAGEAAKLEQALKALNENPSQRRDRPAAGGDAQAAQAAREEQAAKWMARALDELDQSLNKDGPSPSMNPQTMERLAQAQKNASQNSPSDTPEQPGSTPGSTSGSTPGQPGQPGDSSGKPNGDPAQSKPSTAQAGSPGQPGQSSDAGGAQGEVTGQQSAGDQAAQAVREAAMAQARALAQARQPGQPPGQSSGDSADSAMASRPTPGKPSGSSTGGDGQSPGGDGEASAMAGDPKPGQPQDSSLSASANAGASGSGNRGNAGDNRDLPALDPTRAGDWGNLPARLARELMEGQRDEIPAEYRSQVEAYFRAIARKARAAQ